MGGDTRAEREYRKTMKWIETKGLKWNFVHQTVVFFCERMNFGMIFERKTLKRIETN